MRALAAGAVLTLLAAPIHGDAARIITTLHVFGASGYAPQAGIVTDRHGDIVGDTTEGGTGPCLGGAGCGSVFRLLPPPAGGTGWKYQTLYDFQGDSDGSFPTAPVTPAANGAVYGYDADGSNGTIFRLLPPINGATRWRFQLLNVLQGGSDGDLFYVSAPLLASAGHLYGIASGGAAGCGVTGCGSVFRLDPGPSGALWIKTTLYAFTRADGRPQWIAGPDEAGALYVSTAQHKGSVVRLAPPAPPDADWTATAITTFAGGADGRAPGDLVLAPDGSLFGLAVGTRALGNLVYRLTRPAAGSLAWTRSVVAYVSDHGYGPISIALDPDGTLVGAVEGDFDFFAGSLFRLTPPAGGAGAWTFTELWNFNRGPDRNPLNAVTGRHGNIFSLMNGGDSTNGSVVELHTDAR